MTAPTETCYSDKVDAKKLKISYNLQLDGGEYIFQLVVPTALITLKVAELHLLLASLLIIQPDSGLANMTAPLLDTLGKVLPDSCTILQNMSSSLFFLSYWYKGSTPYCT